MYKVEERKIFLDDREAFKYLPRLGWGSQGDVFKIRINNEMFAIKVFNGLYNEALENYEEKLKIDIDSYVSPKKILYIGNKFSGYVMRFCKGKNLEDRKLDITIDEFDKNVIKLMQDTDKLSLMKYNIYDSFISNVMHDEGFRMIDTDNYPYNANKTYDEVSEINTRRLNQMLCEIFIKNAGLGNLYFSNVEFKKLIKKCEDGEILFKELFYLLCSKANNATNTELTNISEVGKVLTKTKKI